MDASLYLDDGSIFHRARYLVASDMSSRGPGIATRGRGSWNEHRPPVRVAAGAKKAESAGELIKRDEIPARARSVARLIAVRPDTPVSPTSGDVGDTVMTCTDGRLGTSADLIRTSALWISDHS
jgi:hypothetical protein